MIIMSETETGIKIVRELISIEHTYNADDGEHTAFPPIERYTITDIGGGREALSAAAYNATQALNRAMWHRVGIKESDDHKTVVVTGTNSLALDII